MFTVFNLRNSNKLSELPGLFDIILSFYIDCNSYASPPLHSIQF
jgi:hypothetical protein